MPGEAEAWSRPGLVPDAVSGGEDPLLGDESPSAGVPPCPVAVVLQGNLTRRHRRVQPSEVHFLHGQLCFYLPGPAVRLDVLPVDHPGHRGREGGPATPVRCGTHTPSLRHDRHPQLSVNSTGQRPLPPATRRARTKNFIVSLTQMCSVFCVRGTFLYLRKRGGEGSDIKTT